MAKGLARVVRVLGAEKLEFEVEDSVADFDGRPDINLYTPEVDYPGLFAHYDLNPTDFREKVANLTNPGVLEHCDEPFRLNWVTSADILAAEAGYIPADAFFHLAAIGAVVTGDNQVLVGIRGGEVTPQRVDRFASGLYGLPPGGSVTFKPEYGVDPITDTIIEEFGSEVGDFDIDSQELLGIFEAYKPGPTGIKFVSKLTTDAKLEQIQKVNVRANAIYNELLGKGATKAEAAAELRKRKLPVDAWEHPVILGVYNDLRSIRYFVETQPQSFSGIGAGALLLYAKSLETGL